ncbi:MAG TPA: hypothetical protein DEB46_02770, partial [Myxococcales bacterium]|nr:hypothetical protein [Myxococcales bacterium]
CGDGFVRDGFEECDDANESNVDACVDGCRAARCGDGFEWFGNEACDDGNDRPDDACLNNCEEAVCGDGVIAVGVETCDDGNEEDADACTNDCQVAVCGDDVVRRYAWLQGERVELAPGEAGYEACDDGDRLSDDRCTAACQRAVCGDGFVRNGDVELGDEDYEGCDDGNDEDADECTNDCTIARCGDEIVRRFRTVDGEQQELLIGDEGYEVCDDGNEEDGDLCAADCLSEPAPNGCREREAEHPAFTPASRDAALCGGEYRRETVDQACAEGWSVCTLAEWEARYPRGQNPGGTQATWGEAVDQRCSGRWLYAWPDNQRGANNQNFCGNPCFPMSHANGDPTSTAGKFLYNNNRQTLMIGDQNWCGWDNGFYAEGSQDNFGRRRDFTNSRMAVFCCRPRAD